MVASLALSLSRDSGLGFRANDGGFWGASWDRAAPPGTGPQAPSRRGTSFRRRRRTAGARRRRGRPGGWRQGRGVRVATCWVTFHDDFHLYRAPRFILCSVFDIRIETSEEINGRNEQKAGGVSKFSNLSTGGKAGTNSITGFGFSVWFMRG